MLRERETHRRVGRGGSRDKCKMMKKKCLKIAISQKELLIKQQLLVYLFEFVKDVQAKTESLDILEGQPVLIELFVYSMHISR